MIQCICGKVLDDGGAYGFHKCKACGRIYSLDTNGWAYHGKED